MHGEQVGQIGCYSHRPTLTDLICSVEKDSEALPKFSLIVAKSLKDTVRCSSSQDGLLASRAGKSGSPSTVGTIKRGPTSLVKGPLPLTDVSV